MTEWRDEATMNVSSDPNQVTVEQILDHALLSSYVGRFVMGNFNDPTNSLSNWEILNNSQNLDGLYFVHGGDSFGTGYPIPESLAYQDWFVDYIKHTTPNSGITARVTDEFDRYKTGLEITYMYDDNGTPTQATVSLETPNSVFKHLMGVPQADPIAYAPAYTLNPSQQEFGEFFQALYQLLTDQNYELMESKMKNRNTPYPLKSHDNPFDDTLALLEQIADTNEPDVYPIGVRYNLTNFGPSQIAFSPPMNDETIPINLGIGTNAPIAFFHQYNVNMVDPYDQLSVQVLNHSPNLIPSVEIEPDPLISGKYLVTVKLATGNLDSVENIQILFSGMGSVIDEATMKVSSDPGQVTVEQILDHVVQESYVGRGLIGNFNDPTTSPENWEVIGNSDNLNALGFGSGDNNFGSGVIPDSLAYQDWFVDYIKRTTPDSGITARVTDEFDRYFTFLEITYMYDDNGTPTQATVSLETPNSVFKHLMGVPQADPIAYQPAYSIIPGQPRFDPFFQALYQLLTDQNYELMESKMKNRNTPFPLTTHDNPFDDTLALLEQIADTNEPDVYPIGVRYNLTNFGP